MQKNQFLGTVLSLFFILMFIHSLSFGGDSIQITDAHIIDGTLTLNGSNFDKFGQPNVSIGDTLLSSCEVTSSSIMCDISGTIAMGGGTWRVIVSAGNSPNTNATIDAFNQVVATQGCIPGDFNECYQGEMNTQGVGICQSGKRLCNSDGMWDSICLGQVLPGEETPFAGTCTNGLDDDCDGLTDGDDNDCCTPTDEVCDGVDNDCDGVIDEGLDCSGTYTCANPYEIVAGGYYVFDFALAESNINLPSSGCTGYQTSGPEVVTALTFTSDSILTFEYYSDGDAAMYIVSDCSAPVTSCIEGKDSSSLTGYGGMEDTVYYGSYGETIYVILDNYGDTNVTNGYLQVNILSP